MSESLSVDNDILHLSHFMRVVIKSSSDSMECGSYIIKNAANKALLAMRLNCQPANAYQSRNAAMQEFIRNQEVNKIPP